MSGEEAPRNFRWFARLSYFPDRGCLQPPPGTSDKCPDAPSRSERCPGCPAATYDDMERGEAGRLLMAALEWRGFVHDGLQVRPEDIPADEYFALRVLKDEEPPPADGEHASTGPHGR